jgi:hypothetical protein
MSENSEFKNGDVVQIDPAAGGFFAGCFMVVTEPKSWGAQGYIMMPAQSREQMPAPCFYRAENQHLVKIGVAAWVQSDG